MTFDELMWNLASLSVVAYVVIIPMFVIWLNSYTKESAKKYDEDMKR